MRCLLPDAPSRQRCLFLYSVNTATGALTAEGQWAYFGELTGWNGQGDDLRIRERTLIRITDRHLRLPDHAYICTAVSTATGALTQIGSGALL